MGSPGGQRRRALFQDARACAFQTGTPYELQSTPLKGDFVGAYIGAYINDTRGLDYRSHSSCPKPGAFVGRLLGLYIFLQRDCSVITAQGLGFSHSSE